MSPSARKPINEVFPSFLSAWCALPAASPPQQDLTDSTHQWRLSKVFPGLQIYFTMCSIGQWNSTSRRSQGRLVWSPPILPQPTHPGFSWRPGTELPPSCKWKPSLGLCTKCRIAWWFWCGVQVVLVCKSASALYWCLIQLKGTIQERTWKIKIPYSFLSPSPQVPFKCMYLCPPGACTKTLHAVQELSACVLLLPIQSFPIKKVPCKANEFASTLKPFEMRSWLDSHSTITASINQISAKFLLLLVQSRVNYRKYDCLPQLV